MKYIIEMIADFLYRQKRRKIWHKIVSFMAAVVVFCTTYALILPAITLEKQLICTIDDIEHVHDETCYSSSQQEEVVQRVYTYEGETTTVKVTLPLDSTVPEDATLTVTPIVDTDDTYAELAQKAEDTMEGQSCEVVLFDISFYTAENEYIPVSEEAMVSFEFKENILPEGEGDVTILHYEDETQDPVALENVKVETDENEEMTAVTFQTEGFSVFAMVKVLPVEDAVTLEYYADINEEFVKNLNGKKFALVANRNTTLMMGAANHNDTTPSRRKSYSWQNGSSLDAYTLWKFSGVDGQYKIFSGNAYLKMEENGDLITTTEDEATIFTVIAGNGAIQILGNGYYINLYQGGPNGFSGYTQPNDIGNYMQLWYYEAPEGTINNLGGKQYAIVNWGAGDTAAVHAETKADPSYNQTTLLKAVRGSVTETAGNKYFESAEEVTLWEFVETAESGKYYIKTPSGQYMHIGGETGGQYNINYSITLADTPQLITVNFAQSTGKVYLTNASGVAVNLFGGEASRGFGGWKTTNYHFILCEKMKGAPLEYNLNLTGAHSVNENNASWVGGRPTVSKTQDVDTDGELLYAVEGQKNERGYYVFCEYMASSANVGNSSIGDIHKYLKDQGKPYGKELSFLGWSVTIDGTEVLFAENAQAVYKDGQISITDVNGIERNLPIGTTLTGKWKEISDTVLFFVNYSGTILDTEGDVTGRNQKEFTPCVGIGRVYYGTTQVGSDNFFATEANKRICALFAKSYNPDNPDTQIVMEYVAEAKQKDDYKFNKEAQGINNTELMKAVLEYIRTHEEVIKLSTADNKNNPTINPANATSKNYEVRWYVKKEQLDAWHIDGVLVAKTQPVEVVKTFSGLDETQTETIMENRANLFGVNVQVKVGDNKQDYLTINKNQIAGQFEYHDHPTGKLSYSWTFNTVLNEQYVMEEINYDLENYNCSTIVVVRTRDGKYHEAYGATTTEAITSVGKYLVGGYAESISFNNFYTKKRTGTFNLAKRDSTLDSNDPAGKLKGAKFVLKEYDETTQTVGAQKAEVTTNANGSANFSNIPIGVYILEESQAPNGYIKSNTKWIVKVIEETVTEGNVTTHPITVKIKENTPGEEEKTLYDKGVMQEDAVVVVNNRPDQGTVVITKKFENLSDENIKALLEHTTSPYTITLSKEGFGTKALNYANRTSMSTDGKSITWHLTGIPSGTYSVLESNFRHISSKDTIVNSSAADEVCIDYINQTAQFDVTVRELQTTNVYITNNYVNQFTMRVLKKNTSDQPLAGAVFEVYGAYGDATNTSKVVSYKHPTEGTEQKAYYIGTMSATNANGVGSLTGLELSTSDVHKTYVLKEITAPSGYALLDEPIVVVNAGPDIIEGPETSYSVSGAGATGTYNNGKFDVTVANESLEQAKTSVVVDKKWMGVSTTGPEIQLQLWRKVIGEDTMQLVEGSQITLDGIVDASETTAWKYEWTNLARYDVSGNEYHYYVEEIPLSGYSTFYSQDAISFNYNSTSKTAGKTKWNVLTKQYELTITNSSSYELPETGGFGTQVYTIGGIVLILLGAFLYRKKRMEVGCVNDS